MHTRRFSLGSLTALFGVVAACGGAVAEIDGPDGGQGNTQQDGGTTVPPTPPGPGTAQPPGPPGPPIANPPGGPRPGPGPGPGPKPPKPPPIGDDDDDVPAPMTCLDPTPIDQTKIPYRAARPATKGACTAQELKDLGAYYKANATDPNFTVTSWRTSVTATCAACIFTDDTAGTAPTWSPIVTANDQLDTVNRGGCIEIVSGKAACGRAYQQYQTCLVDACKSKCTTQADFQACRGDTSVLTSACKSAAEAVKTSCGPKELAGYETACKGATYTFDGPIKVACINGG